MKADDSRSTTATDATSVRLDLDLTDKAASSILAPIAHATGETPLPTTFEAETRRTVAHLQDCMGAALGCLGESGQRAADVGRALGLHQTLAWKVSRLARESDALAAVSFIPGRVAMKRVILAMESTGVPEEITAALGEAFERFLDVGKRHAGSRAAMDMMASAASPQAQRSVEVEHRKQSFLGNAYTWGVQAEAQIRSEVIHPSSANDMVDVGSVRGFYRFQRIRPDVTWPVTRLKYGADHDETIWRDDVRFLDTEEGDSATEGPLLRQFCTTPLPPVHRVLEKDQFVQYMLGPGPVGRTGAMDVMTGVYIREAFPAYAAAEWETNSYAVAVDTPCRNLQFDVFLFDSLHDGEMPEMTVISELTSLVPLPHPSVNHVELPLTNEVVHLGKGLGAARSPLMPQYVQMMRHAFDRLGWDESRFDVFRVTIEYPPIPVVVVLKWRIPEKPIR